MQESTHTPAPISPAIPAGRIRSVQALRAIAALFVVANHATVLWHDKFDAGAPLWDNGNAGVDLFFVISGFIMVVSSRRLQGAAHGWWQFIRLRLIRIVPLYWGLTTLKLAAILAVPHAALHTRPTGWNIWASFLFIPSRDAVGDIRPVLPVGWTLSFEMLFYAVFAVSLFARLQPLIVVAPAMIGLALLSLLRDNGSGAWTSLADPILLEFVFGVVIGQGFMGQGFMQGWLSRRRSTAWPLLAAVCVLCLFLLPAADRPQRVLFWGVPAAVLLAIFVQAEHRLDRYLPALLVRTGEASYSLYLVHGFIIPVVGWAILRFGLASGGPVLLVGSAVLASLVASFALFQWIERPVTNALRARTRPSGARLGGPAGRGSPVEFDTADGR